MNKLIYNGQEIIDFDELADKYTREEVDNLVSTVFKYKGTVATVDDLNNIVEKVTGDCYNVEASGQNYAWNGEEWSPLSGTVDLTNYYTKQQVDGKFGSYLAKNNTTEYTPTEPFHPATKQYVDNNSGGGSGGGVYYHDNASGEPTYLNTLEEGTHIFRSKGLYLIASEELYNTSGSTSYTPLLDGTVYVTEKYDNVADGEYFSYLVVENGGLRGLTKDLSRTAGFKLNSLHDSYIDFLRANADKVINSIFTFNNLPKCSKVPTDDKHFTNKKYVDNTVSSNANSLKSELMSEIDSIKSEGEKVYYLPILVDVDTTSKFSYSIGTSSLNDNFLNAITQAVNEFKYYKYKVLARNDSPSHHKTYVAFNNRNGIMHIGQHYIAREADIDNVIEELGSDKVHYFYIQDANKNYSIRTYTPNVNGNGTHWTITQDNFEGDVNISLYGNEIAIGGMTYILDLTYTFVNGQDITCTAATITKIKNGFEDKYTIRVISDADSDSAQDLCNEMMRNYLASEIPQLFISYIDIEDLQLDFVAPKVKGMTGIYTCRRVYDMANVEFLHNDVTNLSTINVDMTTGTMTYNYSVVTGEYNDVDVTPGYDLDYTKLNKILKRLDRDRHCNQIPITLTRTVSDRTVTYETKANVSFVTTTANGETTEQLSLDFIIVDSGMYLRFYGSGELTYAEDSTVALTENLHCYSEDYNG